MRRPVLGSWSTQVVIISAVVAVAALAAGLRWFGEGRDFLEYLIFYSQVTPYFLTGFSRYEFGFELSAWTFSNLLKVPYEAYATVLAGTALAVKFNLLRRNLASAWLAIIAYLLLYYPIHEYTQIRAAVAIAFAYLGVHRCLDRRYITGALAFLVGFSFHSSVLMVAAATVAFLLIPYRFFFPFLVAGMGTLALLYGTLNELIRASFAQLNPLVSSYLDNSVNADNVNIFALQNILMALTLVSCVLFDCVRTRYQRIFFFFVCIGLVWLLLFSGSPVVAQRTAEMMFVGVIFLAFNLPFSARTIIPQALVLLAGVWAVHNQIDAGVIAL